MKAANLYVELNETAYMEITKVKVLKITRKVIGNF